MTDSLLGDRRLGPYVARPDSLLR
eukprot:COSAG04_NODE_20686_length_388_cov_1.072664_1_plen_23_part_10